jgi:hypothetical protein
MVDNVNPTSQFHPYQPQRDIPASDRMRSGGLGGVLGKLGIDQSKIGAMGHDVRAMAQRNPGKVLGGLAALVIGAGLLRRRGAL